MKNVVRLELEDARRMIAGAVAHAVEIGVPMCIAVTDDGGHLIAFERMDGGRITSATIAIDKAFTAAAARRATHEIGAASQPGAPTFGIFTALGGRMMIVGGGLPVTFEGAVIGGIGVSSGTPAQDQAVAQAGIDAWMAAQG